MSKVKLGMVAREHRGKMLPDEIGHLPVVGLEHLSSGDIDLLGYEEPGDTTFTKTFEEGLVLFGRRRAYLRKASVATFHGVCSGDIIVIEADEKKLSRRLLPFIIQNDMLFDFAVENSAGSLSPRVKWQRLSEYEFDLPSLEEQERLADILWAAQDTRRKYKQLLAASDDIVKARFVEMFGDGKYPRATISELVSGKVSSVKKDFSPEDTIKYIDISSIDNKQNVMTGYTEYVVKEAPSRAQQHIKRGDIVISTVRPNLRNVAITPYGDSNLVASSGFCVLRAEKCLPEYLMAIVTSDKFTDDMTKVVTGANYPAIKDSDVMNYQVALPPIELQEEFAAFVKQIDKSKTALQKSLKDLNAMMAAILNEELSL